MCYSNEDEYIGNFFVVCKKNYFFILLNELNRFVFGIVWKDNRFSFQFIFQFIKKSVQVKFTNWSLNLILIQLKQKKV